MPRSKRKSDVGRALARLNAVTHGLTAAAPVIPGVESPQEWEEHRARIVAALAPADAVEVALAERVAELIWRLRRVQRYESESIATGRERVEFDFAQRQRWGDRPQSVAQAEQRRDDARRCLAIIESLTTTPPDTRLATADVDAILEELAEHAGSDADEFLASITEMAAIPQMASLPKMDGIPEMDGVTAAADGGAWTVGRLLAVLKAIAVRDGDGFTETLAATAARARAIVSGRELEMAQIADEIDRMRRERLLPDARTLDQITRYETTLNRMLYQALNQLEASKSRRAGAPTPLHRIQAFGLPGG